MPITARPFLRRLTVGFATCVAVAVLAACGGDDDRPSTTQWSADWEPIRDEVPDGPTLRAGGEELCGELLGDIRAHREVLLPSPSEAVDDLFQEWLGLVEGVMLDCPHDADDLDERLGPIQDLTRKIDDLTAAAP